MRCFVFTLQKNSFSRPEAALLHSKWLVLEAAMVGGAVPELALLRSAEMRARQLLRSVSCTFRSALQTPNDDAIAMVCIVNNWPRDIAAREHRKRAVDSKTSKLKRPRGAIILFPHYQSKSSAEDLL